jgi:hypothetical protein
MSKNVNTWIEGNGTVRTVFRKLALYEYGTRDLSKLQLIRAVEKENQPLSTLTVQYAIDRRKKEIQWISLYIPLLAFSVLLLVAFGAVMTTRNQTHLYGGIGLMIALSFIYRTTFYSQYVEACRHIYFAGTDLEREATMPTICASSDPWSIPILAPPAEKQELEVAEMESAVQEQPQLAAEDQPTLTDYSVEILPAALEVHLPPTCDPTDSQSEEVGAPGKGAIPTFLLDELIRKECNRPNIYRGDLSKTIRLFAYLSGCNEKNILSKVKSYRSRKSIEFLTPNTKSTHRKYMENLLLHYEETGDDILYKQAEDLQSYLETLPIRQKG